MIKVNLLATDADGRVARSRGVGAPVVAEVSSRRMDPWALGLGATACLLLLFGGWSHWSGSSAGGTLLSQIAQEVTDSTRYATALTLVTELKARQDTIQQKIEMIRAVDSRRYIWPRLMDEVSMVVPAHTWLTRMGASGDDAAEGGVPAFILEGAVHSTQSLTGFMMNLEASPFIRDVTLVTSEQVTGEGRAFHRFTVEARFEMPDSAAIRMVSVATMRN